MYQHPLHIPKLFQIKVLINVARMPLSFIEIGSKQKKDSSKIFASFGMKYIKIIKDYQNLDRILVLKKTKKNAISC